MITLKAIAIKGGIHISWKLNNVCEYTEFVKVFSSPTSKFVDAKLIYEGVSEYFNHYFDQKLRSLIGKTRYYFAYVVKEKNAVVFNQNDSVVFAKGGDIAKELILTPSQASMVGPEVNIQVNKARLNKKERLAIQWEKTKIKLDLEIDQEFSKDFLF